MKFKLSYLNLINPFYYVGKRCTRRIEEEMWGNLESTKGVDLIEQVDVNTEKHSRYQITRPQHLEFVRNYLNEMNVDTTDAIIDIGCGKGGMLLEFSTM